MNWLINYDKSITALVLPLAVGLGLIQYITYIASDVPVMETYASAPQLFGTAAMFSVLPAYMLGILVYLRRETVFVLQELKPWSTGDAAPKLDHRIHSVGLLVWIPVAIGLVYSQWQNPLIWKTIFSSQPIAPFDIAVLVSAAFLWGTIGLLIGWRVPLSWALYRFGRSISVDIYAPSRVRPLANLAGKDVLLIAGAMAFMPLQSLDAEFRWVNYEAGILVGVPSALLLMLLPMAGARAAIMKAKQARLDKLLSDLGSTDREDVGQLEMLSAHIERIRNIPNWPFDARLALRILGYAVIAPLAWVGAALVENLVDQIAG